MFIITNEKPIFHLSRDTSSTVFSTIEDPVRPRTGPRGRCFKRVHDIFTQQPTTILVDDRHLYIGKNDVDAVRLGFKT